MYISGSMIDRVVHVWLHYDVGGGGVRNDIPQTATFTAVSPMIAGGPE